MYRPARFVPWALALLPTLLACQVPKNDELPTGGIDPGTGDDTGSASDDEGPSPGTGGPSDPTDAPSSMTSPPGVDSTTDWTSTGTTDDGSDSQDESGSTSDTSPPQEDTSTGEDVADMYSPCETDDECSSGLCLHGFCTSICWSFVGGETPCPPAPDDLPGVTITCGTISHPGPSGLCTACGDCSAYCIPTCVDDSDCPAGSTCRTAGCTATSYCAGPLPENTDSRCADGQDNDDDGFIDCDDFDCSLDPTIDACAFLENDATECSDGNDNDDDGYIDCDDFNCDAFCP